MKSVELPHLGARIREVRESLGLTQAAFATFCGFQDRTDVVRHEAGRKKRPDPWLLDRIARAGGKSLDWLLNGTQAETDLPRQAAVLVREAPIVYHSLLDDLRGDRRLLQAVQDLIAVLKGPDQEAAKWLVGNILVFAERARGQSRKRKGREAG